MRTTVLEIVSVSKSNSSYGNWCVCARVRCELPGVSWVTDMQFFRFAKSDAMSVAVGYTETHR